MTGIVAFYRCLATLGILAALVLCNIFVHPVGHSHILFDLDNQIWVLIITCGAAPTGTFHVWKNWGGLVLVQNDDEDDDE